MITAPIYLDYNATTPVASEVVDAMLPYLREYFGNPSSAHAPGRIAAAAINTSREQVAQLINAQTREIIFTGCATEANNLALLGAARAANPAKHHLVVSAVEHPSVMAVAEQLQRDGWRLSVVPVDGYGQVAAGDVVRALRPDTLLVSIMHANNEVGTIQPIAEIARITRERGILLHTDAAQSIGKIPVDVDAMGVDLLTLAGHKFYATKGIGVLYVRSGTSLHRVMFGADQEHGWRAGTENVPAIVGLGVAATLARACLVRLPGHMALLRDRLHDQLVAAVPDLALNGHSLDRLPNTLNISFPGVTGRGLLAAVGADVTASVGSACHSEHDTVSGVLAAMAINARRAAAAVRLSVGAMTSIADIDRAAQVLIQAWTRLVGSDTRV